jgi:hypothetical protein
MFPDRWISILRRRMIEDMMVRATVAGDATIVPVAVPKFSGILVATPDRLGLEDVQRFSGHRVLAER